MNAFVLENATYEKWIARQVPVVPKQFELKHEQMAKSVFRFLRATFFRWGTQWRHTQKSLSSGPNVLAVGDLHIENFGTWRDQEGRLAWGVNDFDEAHPMPYLIDIIRLAASVAFATKCEHLKVGPNVALDAILEGYLDGLEAGGRPFVLEEGHSWFRELAVERVRNSPEFWKELEGSIDPSHPKNTEAVRRLKKAIPPNALAVKLGVRPSGAGSLGRQRWISLNSLNGSLMAREAKPLAPSAYDFGNTRKILSPTIARSAIRAHDPYLNFSGKWVIRRLSPHCFKIELSSLPKQTDALHLLAAMGFEIANVHLGSTSAKRILSDLKKRKIRDLERSLALMIDLTATDWQSWRHHFHDRGVS